VFEEIQNEVMSSQAERYEVSPPWFGVSNRMGGIKLALQAAISVPRRFKPSICLAFAGRLVIAADNRHSFKQAPVKCLCQFGVFRQGLEY